MYTMMWLGKRTWDAGIDYQKILLPFKYFIIYQNQFILINKNVK